MLGDLSHSDLEVSRLASWNVRVAARVQLASANEAVRLLATAGEASSAHCQKSRVACAVRNRGAVVARCSVIGRIGISKICLAPSAVKLTCGSTSITCLRECDLTIGGEREDRGLTRGKWEFEEGIATGASLDTTRSLVIVTNFVPQGNLDIAVGSKGDRIIIAVSAAVAQRKYVVAVRASNIALVRIGLSNITGRGCTTERRIWLAVSGGTSTRT